MPLSVLVPILVKGGDTRDCIISILAAEWPLNAKEVYHRATAGGKNITYQAVHKSLKQLEKRALFKRRLESSRLVLSGYVKS